ncbi:cytochrome b [Leeia sp. TBRC 13508]|uniref:Cytochrome b n=1 Tax=Leeia speluncae TaxID=2884804 RepID=A0ABS8D5U8_9NEIS|nr:cytochrome b [Leeia speluncae]MCB6183578.1 cytochrome b [Leeia speluncae]
MKIERYSFSSRALHWLVALFILGAFGLGITMTDMPMSPTKFQTYAYHKWLGITVLALVVIRLINRLFVKVPAAPSHMKPWEVKVANLTHLALYGLMFAVPLIGWLASSAKGFPVVYLKLWTLPDLVSKNEGLGETLQGTHNLLAWTMLILVGLHFVAALKHHFIDRDDVLLRMLPGRK